MKVKATTSFAGAITMAVNEVRELPSEVASPLLACGYLVPVEDKEKAKKPAKKAAEEPAE